MVMLPLLFLLCVEGAVVPLPQYNVNVKGTSSVSGLSSGAYMAVQMHVAFSEYFVGAGIFAGGPYHCAEGNVGTATSTCMTGLPAPNVNTYVSTTNNRAKSGDIDPVSYLATHNIYMFSGTQDTTVKPVVMQALYNYYTNFIDKSKIIFENTLKAAHTQPTDDPVNTNPCKLSATPYISDCDYDGAGYALQQIYGPLNPRNNGNLTGTILNFDQTQFYSNPKSISMDTSGYVYVPAACAQGALCRLHIAFHGCLQYAGTVGTKYVANTGYNKWADTNNIIVLYPQTVASTLSPSNPNGCWDWWGYNTGSANNYDTKSGVQMKTIQSMIDWIGGKYNPIAAPTGLKSDTITDTSITLVWNAVSGATGYNVYRNGAKVNSAAVGSATYVDTGLSSGTTYTYAVTAIASTEGESEKSSTIQATTTGNPPPLTPPTGLAASDITSTSISYKWNAVSGASSYNFYRNSAKITSISTPYYIDTALTPSTTYSVQVTAVNSAGESSPSATVQATTLSSWTCQQFNSSNYAHVQAGRAYDQLGYAYAVGSDQKMGLDNTFYTTVLAETSQGYYVIGTC